MTGKNRLARQQRMLRKRWLKRRGVKRVLYNTALQPIPQRYIASMKYSETFALGSITSGFRLNLNSIFDPNRSGTGHQPYGHDTFATLYNRYRVIACSWVISVYNASSPIRLAAQPANEELSPVSVSEVCENPRTKFIIQYPGGNTNLLKGKISIPSLVGRTKQQYMADDRYQATFGSNPLEAAILNVFTANTNDIAQDNTICTVTLRYKVEMFDVKHLSQS